MYVSCSQSYRLQLKRKKLFFSIKRLRRSTRSHISGNRGYDNNRVRFLTLPKENQFPLGLYRNPLTFCFTNPRFVLLIHGFLFCSLSAFVTNHATPTSDGAGSGADSVGSRDGAGSRADSVGSRDGEGSGADSVGSRDGAGLGANSVGSWDGAGSGADSGGHHGLQDHRASVHWRHAGCPDNCSPFCSCCL